MVGEKNPILVVNKAESHKVVAYAKKSYFTHLRLYEYVFNNKTASELKRIIFKEEEAKVAQTLGNALQISDGRPEDAASRLKSRSRASKGSKDQSIIGGESRIGVHESVTVGDLDNAEDEDDYDEEEIEDEKGEE